MLKNALGTSGIQIKNQTANTTYSTNGWFGSLTSTSVTEMYMIKTSAEIEDFMLVGDVVDPSTTQMLIKDGWTYLGYPVNKPMSVEEAFGATPQVGDVVKGHGYSAMYSQYPDGTTKWYGTLKTMEPGKGYMYYRSNGTSEFYYPTPSESRGELDANVTSDGNYWAPNASAYANNMTIMAVLNVNGVEMQGNYEVAAFSGDEVRGSARPIYVDAIDRYVMFITVYGEGNEELTFKYIDLDTYEVHSLNDVVVYSDNAILGTVIEPMILSYGVMGIGENGANAISLYPNPTTTGRAISFEAVCDMVEVFNSLGVKVAEYRNVESIDGIETAGIYVIRVTNDSTVQNCRLIVK